MNNNFNSFGNIPGQINFSEEVYLVALSSTDKVIGTATADSNGCLIYI